MTTAPAPTHRLHEIGRTECVAEGCEPRMPEGAWSDRGTKTIRVVGPGTRIVEWVR